MGLQQSKNVDAFEAVARCRERKQFTGAAVAARNALAAAHAAYAVALRNTGGALSDYAHYPDHNYDHDHDRDVLVPRYDSSAATTAASSSSSAAAVAMAMAMVQPTETVLPPPPPLPDVPTQLQRAATMPDIPITQPGKKEKVKEKEAIAADAATGEEEYDDDHNSDQDDDDDDDDDDDENSERRNYETASDSVLLKQPTPLPRPQMAASTAQAKGTETWDYYFFGSQV